MPVKKKPHWTRTLHNKRRADAGWRSIAPQRQDTLGDEPDRHNVDQSDAWALCVDVVTNVLHFYAGHAKSNANLPHEIERILEVARGHFNSERNQ